MTQLFSMAILAGGLGTRLKPLTNTLPKSLIPIDGEPFIAHQLRLLKKNNIQRVIICTGFLHDQIQHFIGDGHAFDIEVFYSCDEKHLLGTAGAIKKALPLLDDNFFVLYGDSYLPCDYHAVQKHFLSSNKKALMTIYRNNNQWDKSNVEYIDGKIINYHKHQTTSSMHYIDYGLGVLNQHAFDHVSYESYCDLATVYQHALNNHTLTAFEVHERFYEIGSFQGIKDFKNYLNTMNDYFTS